MLSFASVRARIHWGGIAGIILVPVCGFPVLSSLHPAFAQTVTPDGTLPTQVTQDAGTNQFTVTGGSAHDNNLFHSFDTFSPGDWSVLFDLSRESFGSQIERVFSRVTGENISEINGSLSVLGGNVPDFFVLNPNGILFGPNAQLNLGGSFIGTTAHSIQFRDGKLK